MKNTPFFTPSSLTRPSDKRNKNNMDKKVHFDLDRLRAIPISRVAERWGCRLKKVGVRWVTNCPWHADEHPSLTLYETGKENHCHCFACGKGGSVIDFVMAKDGVDFKEACQRLERTFGVWRGEDVMCGGNGGSGVNVPKKRERPVSYIPREWVDAHVSVENSMSRCLAQMFDGHLVEHLTEEYLLGCYDNGRHEDCVLFPSIDLEGRVRNVKVQHYETDVRSERFAHCDRRCCYWLGKELAKQGVVEWAGASEALDSQENGAEPFFDNECLFGEHLLRRYPNQTVALVESPKNALVGAAVQPKYVWVATGNKAMLKRSVMEVLRGRQVMVFPDRDAIGEWRELLHGMRDIATFSVSDFCERQAAEGDTKFDIADYVVGQFQETVHAERVR